MTKFSRLDGAEATMKYTVWIEGDAGGWSAYSPDVPGCFATGDTREIVLERMRESIPVLLNSYEEMGKPVPDADEYREKMPEGMEAVVIETGIHAVAM